MNNYFVLLCLINIFILAQSSQIWLPPVNGYSDYAGIFGKPISSIRVSGGKEYCVHVLGGNWLPPVTGNDENDAYNGYAGLDGKPIDGFAIKGTKYKVHILGGGWLPEVNQYNINDLNYGMAGNIGQKIDAIMIEGREYAVAYVYDSGSDRPNVNPSGKYSRSDAVAYAKAHALNINHKCGDYMNCSPASYWGNEHCGYQSHGGDCANFVSQCLVLGGGHQVLTGSDNCRGFPCGWEEVGAKRLGSCLKEKGWTSTCGYLQTPPSNIKEGDVLIYHEDNCDSFDAHAVFVTQGGANARIACHSNEKLDVSYKYMGNTMPYYQWLHYED